MGLTKIHIKYLQNDARETVSIRKVLISSSKYLSVPEVAVMMIQNGLSFKMIYTPSLCSIKFVKSYRPTKIKTRIYDKSGVGRKR